MSQHPLRQSCVLLVAFLLAGVSLPGRQASPVFGPRVYTRAEGAPRLVTDRFPAVRPGPGYTLRVITDRVATARVTLNGLTILEPSDFSAARDAVGRMDDRVPPPRPEYVDADQAQRATRSDVLERPVTLEATNSLSVEVGSRPGSSLTITIEAEGLANQPPVVDAGPDLAVTQQDGALLRATVSDDGRAPGDGVRCAWSVTSKPEGAYVSFEPVDAPSTRVLFSTTGVYVLRLTASDGVLSAYDEVTVTVTTEPPNQAPVVSAGRDLRVTRGREATLRGTVSDDGRPAGSVLTVAWTVLAAPPGGSVAIAEPGAATTRAVFDALGAYVLQLTASDGERSASDDLVVTVVEPGRPPEPGNRPPTVSAGGPYSGTAGQAISFMASGSDPDNDPLSYAWTFSNGGAASGQAVTHVFAASGSFTATVTASDGRGGTAAATAVVTVTPPANRPPTAAAGGPYSGTAGQAIAFSGTGSDPDNDPLSFAWSFGDGGTGSGAAAAHTYAAAGTFSATLTVTDGRGGVATATAVVTVAPKPNQAPTGNAGGPYSGVAGEAVTFAGSGADPDNDPLTFTWSFSDGGAAAGASATHAFASAGSYTATLTVSDGRGGTATATAVVTVSEAPPVNHPPTAAAGGPYSGVAGEAVAFAGSGADPDNDPLTFTWSFSDGGAGAGASVTHAFASAGSYTATLTVSDGRGGTATATAAVTVREAPPANHPPTASAGSAYSGTSGYAITFTGSATDADNDPLTFAWSFSDGGLASGASAAHTFAAPGAYTATLTVSDGRGGTATATAAVTVTAPQAGNLPPTAAAGGPYSGSAGEAVSFAASATDPDGDPLAFTWSFGDGSSASGPAAAHVFAAAGTYTATVTVSDGRGGTASASAVVAIVAATPGNQAPTARLSAPAAGTVSQLLTFDASASTDPDADPLTYTWTFGDGATAAGVTTTHGYAVAGTFTVSVTVNDGQGHTHAAAASVRVDPPANRPPVADAGGPYNGEVSIPVLFSGASSRDPDGDALSYAWDFGDGASGTGPGPAHAYTAAGSYTVTLTVADGRDHTATATAAVTITAQPDRTPPVVSVTAPREALPGTEVSIVADATDNVGVVSVVIQVNGEPAAFSAPPYQRAFTLPQMASPGAVLPISVVATDAAGNAGTATASITVGSQPDTESPTVTMFAPPEAAAGSTVTITADARDNVGLALVALLVDGVQVAGRAAGPYEFSWTVPADAPAGTTYQLLVRATDYAGHSADVTGTLAVVAAARDTQAPSVSLTLPPAVAAGSPLLMAAVASDNVGVASVAFFVDGARIATLTSPPYDASYLVPGALPAGAVLRVEARAVDGVGLSGSDVRTATVTTTVAPGEGVLLGRVYDDVTGLPVEGALVTASGRSALGVAYTRVAASDARGGYVLAAPAGEGVLRVTKTGMTAVDRQVAFVADARARRVFDARLTPLAEATAVGAVLGGRVAGDHAELVLPAAAVASDVQLALTVVGGQGLQGLLPVGWSPVAVVDVAPHGVAFTQPAQLVLTVAPGLPAGTPLVLAQWDELAAAWRALGTGDVRGDGTVPEAAVEGTGQYAWLLADAQPSAPPVPLPGDVLAGVVPAAVPEAAAAVISPDPRVIFYSPGARSAVSGSITTGTLLSSGTRVTARLTESYRFTSGTEVHPEPRAEDLVLYQAPGSPERVSATFPATPSIAFEAIALQQGVIRVELSTPDPDVPLQVVAGAGGSLDGPTAERLDVPAGALPAATPIDLRAVSLADTGLTVPAGLEFLGGVGIAFSGELARPAILSIVKPPAAVSADRIVLARLAEVQGETRLVFAARARFDGDRLVADVTLPGVADLLEGVRLPGRYLFLQASSPIGFFTGTVSGVDGVPFAGAWVKHDRLALGSFSSASGRYASALPGGAARLEATDLVRNDSGSAAGTVVAGVSTPLDLRLQAQPPSVILLTPPEGAANVALSEPIVVRFSEPVNPGTITVASILLTGPSGAVAGTLSLSAGNTVAVLRPSELLSPDAAYTVTVAGTIADVSGYTMGAPVVRHFTSLDTTAPVAPPAGSLSATIPTSAGLTTVRGTQGSAGPHDSVRVINVTKGTSTPALVNPDGSFSATVLAGNTDELKVEIQDAAGNTTTASLPAFRQVNADGGVSQVIGKNGGHMEGPAGIALDAVAGTFPEGAIVTIKAVTEADFPVQLTPEQATVFSYAAGLTLDFGGAQPQHYLNVSVPAGPNDKPGESWMVSQVVMVDGEPKLNVVDTAKLIDGRVATSSPPCPGVLAAGMYGLHKSAETMAVIYGSGAMQQTADLYRAIATQPSGLGGSFVLPGGQYFDGEYGFCIPIMTSRVTLSLNAVDLAIPFDSVTPDVVELRVHDTKSTRDNRWKFSRDQLYLVVRVPAQPGQTYTIDADYSNGATKPLPFVEEGVANGTATFRIGLDDFPATATGLTVTAKGPLATLTSSFSRGDLDVVVRVQGAEDDVFEVSKLVFLVDRLAGFREEERTVPDFDARGIAGRHAMVLRAIPGTIDPTEAEVLAWNAAHPDEPLDPQGRFRTRVDVFDATTGVLAQVPDASIVEGGFTYNFPGELGHKYSVIVSYAAPYPQESFEVRVFTLTLSTRSQVVKVITLPAPPVDQPLKLPRLADDTTPPDLTGNLLLYRSMDPSGFLSFTFTESMDADSLKKFFLVDNATGNRVPGRIIVSERNTVLTFVPDTQLRMAATYTASFAGVTDLAGNAIANGYHLSMTLTTATPRIAGGLTIPLFDDVPGSRPATVLDFQFLTQGGKRYAIGVTNEQDGNKVVTVDVTDPTAPIYVKGVPGGYYKNRLSIVSGLDFGLGTKADRGDSKDGANPCTSPPSSTFKGRLAFAANANMYSSAVQFFDITNPETPCMAGMKMLTANPNQLSAYTEVGTQHVLGFARAVAVLDTTQGPMAYTAVQGAGLFATEVRNHIPEVEPYWRRKDPMLPGDYSDVVTVGDRLLALDATARELHAVAPDLALLAAFPVAASREEVPHVMSYREGVPWDANGDGTLLPGEFLNLAVLGTDLLLPDGTYQPMVRVVDATRLEGMRLVAAIPLPRNLHIRALELDAAARRLWVATSTNILVVDLSGRAFSGLLDGDGDNRDDRVVWISDPTPYSTFGLRLDEGYVYLATTAGLQVMTLDRPNLHGTATYTYFPVDGVVGIDLDHPEKRPVRHAKVVAKVPDPAGAGMKVIGHTYTDELGRYEIQAPRNTQVTLVLEATVGSPAGGTEISVHNIVMPAQTQGTLHAVVDDVDVGATGAVLHDLEAATTVVPGTRTYDQRIGGAFNLLDMLYEARRTMREVDPTLAGLMKPLDILWTPGVNPGTACGPTTMYVNGDENKDTDEYDRTVILHEYGHSLISTLSRSDNPGGDHATGAVLDFPMAFNEGLVTTIGNALANSPVYVDTGGVGQRPLTATSLEDGPCDFFDAGAGALAPCGVGSFDEFTVMALLWDIYDGVATVESPDKAPADDAVSLGLEGIWQVLRGPIRDPGKTPRFVSLRPFLYHLTADARARGTSLWKNFGTLFAAWKIDSPVDDVEANYYVDLPVDAPAVEVFPFEHPAEARPLPGGLPPHVGERLGTRSAYGATSVWKDDSDHTKGREGNNKLYNRIVLKADITTAAKYGLTLFKNTSKTLPLWVDVHRHRNPNDGWTPSVFSMTQSVETTEWLMDLQPGTWLFVVTSQDPTEFTATLRTK